MNTKIKTNKMLSFFITIIVCCGIFNFYNSNYNFISANEACANNEETLIPYEYSEEHKFSNECIIIVLKTTNGNLNKKWNISDFAVDNISSIDDLTFMDMSSEEQQNYLKEVNFHQILKINLKEKSRENVLKAIKEFEKIDSVLSAEPDFLPNKCSDSRPSGYHAFTNTNIYNAWNITTGAEDVKVGIIDSGIADVSAVLTNNVNYNLGYDFYNNNNLTSDDTDPNANGHGTKVASVIGSIYGVCWKVKLIPLQVWGGGVNEWISAITYAQTNNIKILNLSYTVNGTQSALKNAISNYTGLLVCSAGNENIDIDNSTPIYPACFDNDNIITVGGANTNKTLTYNWGANSVDLAAPAKNIWVINSSGDPQTANGTSFASPMVAGTAALLLSYNSNLTALEIKDAILNNVDHISSYSGKLVSEGILNAKKALDYVKSAGKKQNIVISVNKNSLSSISSFNFHVIYNKNYQEYCGMVNGSIIPSGNSVSYNQTSSNNYQWDLYCHYSGSPITSNTGTIFKCKFKTNLNETFYDFNNSITISNPSNLPYITAVLGDINNDGLINSTDQDLIMDYVTEYISLNSRQYLAADVNCDGTVNVSDYIYIGSYISGSINSFF